MRFCHSGIVGLLVLAPFAPPARGCKCISAFLPCNQTVSSDVVFIGTVESIEPLFLSRWNHSNQASMAAVNQAYVDARQHPSPESIDRLKQTYRKAFPALAAQEQERLQSASTAAGVASLFYSGIGRGMLVHFQVKTLFKHEADDDAPKSAEKDEGETSLDVWTPFGDCGYDFQAGETYVVYANNDEGSADSLSTDICTRTRRLSEAGEDLTYLFFYKNNPKASTRLEGFTTMDELYRVGFDRMHDPRSIRAPVTGVVVELQSAGLTRFTESDGNGRFVFDGLPEGDYQLSAYAAGYPVDAQLLAGPQPFRVAAKSCSLQVLLLPKEHAKQ